MEANNNRCRLKFLRNSQRGGHAHNNDQTSCLLPVCRYLERRLFWWTGDGMMFCMECRTSGDSGVTADGVEEMGGVELAGWRRLVASSICSLGGIAG